MPHPSITVSAALVILAWPVTAHSQESPEPRAHHQIVYHDADQSVYLLGGSTPGDDSYRFFDDIWSWTEGVWMRVDSLPFPRSSHAIAYHPGRQSIILFGGGSGSRFTDDGTLWEWKNSDFSGLAESPSAGRAEPGMCYDPGRDRLVVFGGWDSTRAYSGTTLEWVGDELVIVDAAGPSPRAGHAFVYDPVNGHCLLFGGRGPDGYLTDTWLWEGTRWLNLGVSGPSERGFFGAATDHSGGRIVIFGGSGPDEDLGDTWAWNGESWSLLTEEGPAPRGMARLASDGSGILLFGGRSRTADGFEDRNDTWRLEDRTWIPISRPE